MEKESKIYIAGHRGMVGSAIVRKFKEAGYTNLIVRSRGELDLMNQHAVQTFMNAERPDYVIVAAAKVGGIYANNTYPAQFLYENIQIETHLIHHAYISGVKKLIFLGSSCIYPQLCPQPMKEEYLLTGPLEPTNEAYAIAKIAGIKMCENYYHQYGANFMSIMPSNLYGIGDNFHLMDSHVLPALIRKFHEAKYNHQPFVTLWGTGIALREFLYVDDIADATLFIMNNISAENLYNEGISHINVGSGKDISIADLALLIKQIVGFEGEIKYDSSQPDGMPIKRLDISRLSQLGWKSQTELKEGIQKTYQWFCNQLEFENNIRL